MEEYINILLKKIKNMGIKKLILIIILVLLVVIIIHTISKYVEKEAFKNKVEDTEYSNMEDFETAREYIVYRGNEYIKEEKSEIEGFSFDIYLKFKVAPFENNKSNEVFYKDIINIVSHAKKYSNFRLIDKERKITITVQCDQQDRSITRILINGEENYFSKRESIIQLQDYEYKERTFDIQSTILKNLINEEWASSKVNLGLKKETKENYSIYNDFMVRIISRKVYNIVFNENYNESIINNIKVGTDFQKVKEILGEPDFVFENLIGYRGKDIYIFFGSKTVSVYRTEDITKNDNFLEIAEEFRKDKEAKRFASKITDIWDDYNKYEVNENYINIEYALRGIKIQFNVTEEHGIIIYGNYKGEIEKGNNIMDIKNIQNYELPLYTYIKPNQDLVFETEIERVTVFKEVII